jgi:hypothetical protein
MLGLQIEMKFNEPLEFSLTPAVGFFCSFQKRILRKHTFFVFKQKFGLTLLLLLLLDHIHLGVAK